MVVGRAVERHRPLPTFGSQARGPGMFALCEADEITTLLESSGFAQVTCTSFAPTILLGGGGEVDDSLDFLLGMGMVRGLIGQAGEDNRDAVVADVRRELEERYEPGVGVPTRSRRVVGHRPELTGGCRRPTAAEPRSTL